MLGEFLYQLSAKDTKGTMIELVKRVGSYAVAGTGLAITWQVPADRVWLIKSATINAQPGAAQFSIRSSMLIGEYVSENAVPGGQAVAVGRSNEGNALRLAGLAAASQVYYEFDMDDLLVPAGSAIGLQAVFDAGAAINTMYGGITGISIPRGNIVFGG